MPSGKINVLSIPKLSTNSGLWETTSIVPGKFLKVSAIIVWVSGSKWLVGSSNIKKLAPLSDNFAKATLLRSPGDKIPTFLKTSSPENKNLPKTLRNLDWEIFTSAKLSIILLLLSSNSCSWA